MAYAEVLGVNLKCSTVVSRILPHFSIAFERCVYVSVWNSKVGEKGKYLDLNMVGSNEGCL